MATAEKSDKETAGSWPRLHDKCSFTDLLNIEDINLIGIPDGIDEVMFTVEGMQRASDGCDELHLVKLKGRQRRSSEQKCRIR
jgi:hypothetical protein